MKKKELDQPLLLLHSSNFSERYQRNILDFLCYPAGHIVTLRYEATHVEPAIAKLAEDTSTADLIGLKRPRPALSVYAEIHDDGFRFFPVRYMKVLRIHQEGTVFYVDAALGAIYRYPAEKWDGKKFPPSQGRFGPLPHSSSVAWNSKGELVTAEEVPTRPGKKGFFLSESATLTEVKPGHDDVERLVWERAVDVISTTESMRRCIFFAARLSQVQRRRKIGVPRSGFERVPLEPSDQGFTTRYLAPAASRLELTVLSYRGSDADRSVLPQTLALEFGSEAFGAASHKELRIINRYNEDRVEVPTRRVLERVAGGIRLGLQSKADVAGGAAVAAAGATKAAEQSPAREPPAASPTRPAPLLAPEPFLLVYVTPPRRTLAVFLIGATIAALLLSLGPDSMPPAGRLVSRYVSTAIGGWMEHHAGAAAGLSKALGGVVTLITGYLGLRRLPVGK